MNKENSSDKKNEEDKKDELIYHTDEIITCSEDDGKTKNMEKPDENN